MKKITLFIAFLFVIAGKPYSQKVVSGVSESKHVNISKDQQVVSGGSDSKFISITGDPFKPPYLEIVDGSLQFTDFDGDNKIDANENATIRFKVINSGSGPGLGLKVNVLESNGIIGLTFDNEIDLDTLETGESRTVEIPVSAKMNLQEGLASFRIWLEEANGFGMDPFTIDVKTQYFLEPAVKIVDYQISSPKGSTLQKRVPFDIKILVQNIGQGDAEDVKLNLPVPVNVITLSGNEYINIGTLKPGESRRLDFSLVTNNLFSSDTLPINFYLTEKYGKYAEEKFIALSVNQQFPVEKHLITGQEDEAEKIVTESLVSDIDNNIPYNNITIPDRIALIIGNENYSERLNAEINVDYARHDAEIFRKYALNTMGVEDRNLYFLLDATAGKMNREIDLVAELVKRIGDDAELIFFYAGHGFPDEVTKVPYLIPVDVDATNLGSAIKLSEIYKKFGESESKRITIFLDACFSGGGRNQGLLAARSVVIKPIDEELRGNMVVFAASTGFQSALPYHSEKHGMFTYYLLKKIKDTEGNITYGELADYLKETIGIESLRENRKPQDPQVNVSPAVQDVWAEWKFR